MGLGKPSWKKGDVTESEVVIASLGIMNASETTLRNWIVNQELSLRMMETSQQLLYPHQWGYRNYMNTGGNRTNIFYIKMSILSK